MKRIMAQVKKLEKGRRINEQRLTPMAVKGKIGELIKERMESDVNRGKGRVEKGWVGTGIKGNTGKERKGSAM